MHVIIDREVGSVIRLRAESIEINVPAKVPALEITPPSPDREPTSTEPFLNHSSVGTSQTSDIPNNRENGSLDIRKAEQSELKNAITAGNDRAVVNMDVANEISNLAATTRVKDIDEATHSLDNAQTINLDEADEKDRTYGLAIVLNGKSK